MVTHTKSAVLKHIDMLKATFARMPEVSIIMWLE